MSSSATGVGMPICFLGAILLILTQKSSQKFGDVLGIMVPITTLRVVPIQRYRQLPPNVETTLTLNADGTYLLIRPFKEKQNEQEKLRGSFHMLDGNVLMLVHPSSGDNIFYKVMEDNSIIMTDSFGNEPEGETARFYVLKKRK